MSCSSAVGGPDDVPYSDRSAGADSPLVVGFGEALVRLTAQHRQPLEHAGALTMDVGGAELNVLVALAQLGVQTCWVSRLPRNPLGYRIASHARRHGVGLEIDWESDARAGLYFVEEGAHPRPTQVLYDRAGSSASRLQPGTFEWHRILSSAAALHTTGITCALNAAAEEAVLEALALARAAGVVTSFDLNYRSQLWSPEAAASALRRVLPLADLLFASPFDLALISGEEASADLAEELRRAFGMTCVVVRTHHEVSPAVLRVNIEAYSEDQVADGSARASVLDPFGAGDAAVAAFLARWLARASLKEAVGDAARASAYMYTIPGDTWLRPATDLTDEHGRLGRISR